MNLSSNLSWFLLGRSNASVCPEDCLKRGSCSHGTCLCEVSAFNATDVAVTKWGSTDQRVAFGRIFGLVLTDVLRFRTNSDDACRLSRAC